jgi:hypothetical protein
LRIHSHALRRAHGIAALIPALDKLVLVILEIKDVNSVRARIGDNLPAAGIHRNAVGPHQVRMVRLSHHHIHQLGEESALAFNFLF